jgi:hypothetical protein
MRENPNNLAPALTALRADRFVVSGGDQSIAGWLGIRIRTTRREADLDDNSGTMEKVSPK